MPRPLLLALGLLLAAPLLAPADRGARADAPMRTVSGTLTYLERIALPEGAELVLVMRDAGGAVLASERVPGEGRQVPIPFRLWVPSERAGSFTGGLEVAGMPGWRGEPVRVPAGTAPVDLGEIVLRREPGAAPPPAAEAEPEPAPAPAAEAEPEPAPAPAAEAEPAPAPLQAIAADIAMVCGDVAVMVGTAGERARLELGGEAFDLVAVPAASGARYEAEGDPETFFWSRGDRALVSVRGESLPECVMADAAAAAPAAFRARGNEPGWSVVIANGRMDVLLDYGSALIEAAAPEPESDGAATIWRLPEHDLELRVEDRICADTMSGMPYPLTARLTRGAEVYDGCAGEAAALLEGPEWQVERVGDREVAPGEVTMEFLPEGRVAGRGGCNRFMGGFTITGESLGFGPLASTMMACPDPQMELERAFFDAVEAVDLFAIDADGALVLLAAGAPAIVARR